MNYFVNLKFRDTIIIKNYILIQKKYLIDQYRIDTFLRSNNGTYTSMFNFSKIRKRNAHEERKVAVAMVILPVIVFKRKVRKTAAKF